ncbi:hypothetical protein [Aliidiomarina quisquiliarum]|uniref:hypothetical protein n=1 Tax=Aliidiomarina quisquiliarum TaxID=2938947 RepID=UPI00208E6409|nr:hypothetical protein [Aliidiomarina quisquiliarum]MCO4320023.1 hypothetical protein [Aliidiomarina quisquiliarum]
MEIQVQKTEVVRISKEEQIKIALNLLEDHFQLMFGMIAIAGFLALFIVTWMLKQDNKEVL